MTKIDQKIPEGWSVKKLGELCLNSPDYGLNESAVPFNRDLPLYLRITDISEDGKYISEGRVSVKYYKLEKLLSKNNLLFARTGATVGKTYLHGITNEKIAFAGYLIRFILDENKINPYFLFLYSHTQKYWNWVKVYSMRSGQPGINSEEYSLLPILLPPLAEQEKIAEILSCWDEGIEKLSALIEKKKIQKKALMQQLLTGKHRLKGFSTPWYEVKLGDVCKTFSGGTPSVKNQTYYGGNIPFIRSGEIHLGRTELFITNKALESSSAKLVSKGDVLYALYGATSGEVNISKIDGAINQAILCIRSQYIGSYFLCCLLQNKKKNILRKYLQGGQGNLSAEIIKSLPIQCPCQEEQKAIADILSKADEEIELLNKKLEAFKLEKKALMQKLLTGKIRVKVN